MGEVVQLIWLALSNWNDLRGFKVDGKKVYGEEHRSYVGCVNGKNKAGIHFTWKCETFRIKGKKREKNNNNAPGCWQSEPEHQTYKLKTVSPKRQRNKARENQKEWWLLLWDLSHSEPVGRFKDWRKYSIKGRLSAGTHLWKELKGELESLQRKHLKVKNKPCFGNNRGDFRVTRYLFGFLQLIFFN